MAFWWALASWLLPVSTGFAWLDGWLTDYLIFGVGAPLAWTITVLLFPAVVTTFAGLFADRIAAAVERTHYPHVTARDLGILSGIEAGLRLLGTSAAIGLLVIGPLWLLFAGMPVWFPLWFAILGYLLGREYFDAVAGRRCSLDAVAKLRNARFLEFWAAGLLIAGAFLMPFSAWFAPSFGTALMVHVVERGLSRGTPPHGPRLRTGKGGSSDGRRRRPSRVQARPDCETARFGNPPGDTPPPGAIRRTQAGVGPPRFRGERLPGSPGRERDDGAALPRRHRPASEPNPSARRRPAGRCMHHERAARAAGARP